jgi:hypothetical protein
MGRVANRFPAIQVFAIEQWLGSGPSGRGGAVEGRRGHTGQLYRFCAVFLGPGELAVTCVQFPRYGRQGQGQVGAVQLVILHLIDMAAGWLKPYFQRATFVCDAEPIGANAMRPRHVEIPAANEGVCLGV